MSEAKLLCDIHQFLVVPEGSVDIGLVQGKYEYYHYLVDGVDDQGWGCGYRTLQTLCSWVGHTLSHKGQSVPHVPSLKQIQETLVQIGDKPSAFVGSRDWIGSFEVCLCLDQIYDVSCKILHVRSGRDVHDKAGEILKHFQEFGSPVMIGGDSDCSSKTLLGVCKSNDDQHSFLIADPHFVGEVTAQVLVEDKWLQWKLLSDVFQENSFYNFCLPQLRFSKSASGTVS